jgi:hypothetical protein
VAELNSLPGRPGYVTETFCVQSRFFQPHNGERIDAVREAIEPEYRGSPLEPVLLTSLVEAADRVDSTTGVQMAYVKQWAPRSFRPLELRVPELLPGPGHAVRGDACAVVAGLGEFDLAYLDPPYNQHRYEANYHIWETLVAWDAPPVLRGGLQADGDPRRAPQAFNSRRTMVDALAQVVRDVQAEVIVLSYNDESWIDLEALIEMCRVRGHVEVLAFPSNRYVGCPHRHPQPGRGAGGDRRPAPEPRVCPGGRGPVRGPAPGRPLARSDGGVSWRQVDSRPSPCQRGRPPGRGSGRAGTTSRGGRDMGALDGRVAIITGAGRGIGREHALLFAAEGAKVVVNDLGGAVDGSGDDRSPAQQVVDEITAMGAEAIANDDDIADWEGGRRLVEATVDAFGDLHVLVNNAGILRDKMLVNMAEDWDSVIHVHLKGHFVPTRHAAAYWREQVKDGREVIGRHRQHLVDLGSAREPGPDQLRRRQGRDRRLHRHRRPGALPLRRARERHRTGRPYPDDRADAGPG